MHSWPAAHWGSAPQRHSPSLLQVSDRSGLQLTHVSPVTPHRSRERGVQTSPSQHPSGQARGPQRQAPPRHSSPSGQGAPEPQRQRPLMHRSAAIGLQDRQASPAAPQEASVGGETHPLPLQQPSGQELILQPLQAPPSQTSPSGQLSQAAAADPQYSLVVPDRQVSPSQQPAQEVESHRQIPSTQRWPISQAGPLPQRHRPLSEHRSDRVAEQLWQSEPSKPHVSRVGDSQVLPAQQPPGSSRRHRRRSPSRIAAPADRPARCRNDRPPRVSSRRPARGSSSDRPRPRCRRPRGRGRSGQTSPSQQP